MATTYLAPAPARPLTTADAWRILTARAAVLATLARRLDAVDARLARLECRGRPVREPPVHPCAVDLCS